MPLHCPNCGAPVSGVPAETTCRFCQSTLLAPLPPVPHPAARPQSPAPRRGPGNTGVTLGPLLLLAFVGAVAYLKQNSTWQSLRQRLSELGVPADWNGREPLTCGGKEQIEASDVVAIYTSGTAIDARGDCRVQCTRCTIKAPVGVSAGGHARVVLVHSTLEGSHSGVVAAGNAEVKLLGSSSLVGGIVRGGSAQVTPPTLPSASTRR
jgi:hypothetical protein